MRDCSDEMTDWSDKLTNWCSENITEALAKKLDQGEANARDSYARLAQEGFLEDVLGVEGMPRAMELMRIVSAASGTLANAVGVNISCATLLHSFGSDAHKERAAQILKGQRSAAFCLTEEFAGSDVPNQQTKLSQGQDGNWIISGEKWFATGAQAADDLLVVARSSEQGDIRSGFSVVCVAANADGVEVEPMPKLAGLGFASCIVRLNEVALEEGALVGGLNQAWGAMAFTGMLERLLVAAAAVGLSQNMIQFASRYALKRQVASEPIFNHQAISHSLAKASTQITAAGLMVDNAVAEAAAGRDPSQAICMAKLFASEVQQEVSLTVMKALGGRAYLDSFSVGRWQREGQLSLYAGGTNEVQLNLIARAMSKRYGEK